jgi:hypothetical protein
MGAHFKLIDSETVDVTPQLAAEFSAMAASATERDIKSKRLDYLRDAVLGGTAIAFTWTKAKVAASGKTYRVNGHHSSTMLAELNGDFPAGLKAHIDTYEVPDDTTLGLLFQQIDSRQSARTVDDISGAYQGLQPDLAGVPKLAGRKAIEGYVWYEKNKVGNDVPSGDARFNLFFHHNLHPFIQMTGRILSVKTPEFTTPVIGAMYGAYDRDPLEAERFYGDVAKQGGGNDVNHPAAVLDAWLVASREEKENKPKEQEVYYACAYAWNAYRNSKTLDRGIPKFNKKKGAPELD